MWICIVCVHKRRGGDVNLVGNQVECSGFQRIQFTCTNWRISQKVHYPASYGKIKVKMTEVFLQAGVAELYWMQRKLRWITVWHDSQGPQDAGTENLTICTRAASPTPLPALYVKGSSDFSMCITASFLISFSNDFISDVRAENTSGFYTLTGTVVECFHSFGTFCSWRNWIHFFRHFKYLATNVPRSRTLVLT